jgi:hypothetical protein
MPAGGIFRIKRLAKAPRALNTPACCMSSSLNVSATGSSPKSLPFASSTGVRRMCGRISRYAAAMRSRVTTKSVLATSFMMALCYTAFKGTFAMPKRDIKRTAAATRKLEILRSRIQAGVDALERGDFVEVDGADLENFLKQSYTRRRPTDRRRS